MVRLRTPVLIGASAGDYRVVAALPADERGVAQYRVRRLADPHEPVVQATDIVDLEKG
jgi:hypothetical protein